MSVSRCWFAFVALLACGLSVCAQAGPQDATVWLHRLSQAPRTLSYSGTFIYESNGHAETSRVVHVVDGAGQIERVESLDGPPREVIRTNDEVNSFFPQERLLVIDRAAVGGFPGRSFTVLGSLNDFYMLRLGETARVAGREAQSIRIDPRDDLRYGHEWWVDTASGLLLKARMLRGPSDVVEQFTFTELNVGGQIERERAKPRFSRGQDWTVFNARGVDLRSDEAGWVFRGLPPGFKQVSLSRRPVRSGAPEAIHAVFSDGLAAISVFIEPVSGRNMSVPPRSHSGPISLYRTTKGENVITALGEVPTVALKRVAEGVEPAQTAMQVGR